MNTLNFRAVPYPCKFYNQQVSSPNISVTVVMFIVKVTCAPVYKTKGYIHQSGVCVYEAGSPFCETGSRVSEAGSHFNETISRVSETVGQFSETRSLVCKTTHRVNKSGSHFSEASAGVCKIGGRVSETGSLISKPEGCVKESGNQISETKGLTVFGARILCLNFGNLRQMLCASINSENALFPWPQLYIPVFTN